MRFTPASDQSLLVTLGDEISLACNGHVVRLFQALQAVEAPAITGISPAYNSILIRFDARRATHAEMEALISDVEANTGHLPDIEAREIVIPVRYDGPDLNEVAELHQFSPKDVAEIHAGQKYRCYLLGFVPGFAYLGDVPAQIATPRRSTPRKYVPAGSVGIAGQQTGIYPVSTPGGWNLIGTTAVSLFDLDRGEPLIRPGDTVRFEPIAFA